MLIVLIVLVAVGAGNAYLGYTNSQKMDKIKPIDANLLAEQIVSAMYNPNVTATTAGPTIPVAGG
jgi:hypothetical protein